MLAFGDFVQGALQTIIFHFLSLLVSPKKSQFLIFNYSIQPLYKFLFFNKIYRRNDQEINTEIPPRKDPQNQPKANAGPQRTPYRPVPVQNNKPAAIGQSNSCFAQVPNQKYDQKFPMATLDTQDSSLGHYNEISLINIYSADLKIKARVITKSQMRTYNNQKGQGHVFSVLLLDGSSAPENVIKGTFFNEHAIKFNELVFEGQIYVFSKGDVKPKNTKFNNTKHSCELLFNKMTTIESAAECVRIPENSFNFELISAVEKYPKWHELDILVIIRKIGQPEEINLKNGGKKCKREVTVFDESKKSIEIVMWGADTTINGFEH